MLSQQEPRLLLVAHEERTWLIVFLELYVIQVQLILVFQHNKVPFIKTCVGTLAGRED